MSIDRSGESAQLVHRNPWFAVLHRLGPGDGERYRVVRADSVLIVPRIDESSVALLYGVRDTTGELPRYEFPAGGLDAEELPEAAARRELVEETGYRARTLTTLGRFVESPGISAAATTVYLADDLEPGPQELEPQEDWTVRRVRIARLGELIRAGEMVDAGSIAAFGMFLCRTSD